MDNITKASDIALPIEVVELKHLRTKSGEPVKVLCGGADELVLQRVTKRLPGLDVPKMDDDLGQQPSDVESVASMLKAMAPAILEAGTALAADDGKEIRPAFYWDSKNAVSGSISGNLLRLEDLNTLVTAVLRAGGYLPAQEVQADATFPD